MLSFLGKVWSGLRLVPWMLYALLAVPVVLMLRRKPKPAAELPPIGWGAVTSAQRDAAATTAAAESQVQASQLESERVSKLPLDELLAESQAYARRKRRTMPPTVPLLAFLFALALPLLARAEPLPVLLDHPTTHDHGWWIPDDTWRAAMADAAALVELQEAVPKLRAAALQHQHTAELRAAALDIATLKLTQSQEQLDQSRKWYRSPRFLVPLGVVIGAVAGGLLVGVSQ